MSNPQDAPLPNPPEAAPANNKKQKRQKSPKSPKKPGVMKRFFKKMSIGPLFARKKGARANQLDQGQLAFAEPEEMHEMQELQNPTEWVEQQHYHIEKPPPQSQSQAQTQSQLLSQQQPQPQPQTAS